MNTLPALSRACTRRIIVYRTTLSNTIERSYAPQPVSARQPHRSLSSTTAALQQVQDQDLAQVAPLPPAEPISFTQSSGPSQSETTSQPATSTMLTGTVTRTATMQSCIQITHMSQKYDKHLQKHYTRPNRLLVHDPNPAGYLREGDIIEYSTWTTDEKQARTQRKHDIETQLLNEKRQQQQQNTNTTTTATTTSTSTTPSNTAQQKKPKIRQGRRFMTGKKQTGNHGTGEAKWVGPRYVFRRVVTPFGTGLDQRMEELVHHA